MIQRYPVLNLSRPRMGQAAAPAAALSPEVERAWKMLEKIRKNYANIATLLGEAKAQEAVTEAEAALEAAQERS